MIGERTHENSISCTHLGAIDRCGTGTGVLYAIDGHDAGRTHDVLHDML